MLFNLQLCIKLFVSKNKSGAKIFAKMLVEFEKKWESESKKKLRSYV